MIWKPKEKELTPEEAVAVAKKELTPFWFGSPPLLAGIEHEGRALIVPLTKEFTKKGWMIFFIDPTDFEGENAIAYAKEWYRRYHLNNLGFILVLVPSYDFLRQPAAIHKLIEKQQISFPVVLDAQGELAHAMNATHLPKIVLLDGGQVIQAYECKEAFSDIENRLQKFLRTKDRGLPLLPLYTPKVVGIQNVDRYEFGYMPRMGASTMAFPAPGFVAGEDGIRRAKFVNKSSAEGDGDGTENISNPEKFVISGEWQQYPEGIVTSDPTSSIRLISPAQRVSLIAAPAAGKVGIDSPRISIDVGGMGVYDAISGEDIKMEDSGETQIRVVNAQFYHILVGLPKKQRSVGFKFPNANRSPVALYGFRFGE